MEFFILFVLILLNGIFSMAEIALVSARKLRLEGLAKKGNKGARKALSLANEPNRFLSTVQIGITLIGIFTGIYSGENFSKYLDPVFEQIDWLAPYAHKVSVAIIVLGTTYLTLVIGELVPKQIGLMKAENIAMAVARPMNFMSKIAAPFVWLLSGSTNIVMRFLNVKRSAGSRITEDEIKAIIEEGTAGGEVQEVEQDIVERVFSLGDRKIASLITHRSELAWLDINDTPENIHRKIQSDFFFTYPVADKSLDNIIGVVGLKELFIHLHKPDFNLKAIVTNAPYIPENLTVYGALELFKKTTVHYALVTDEFGVIQGIITLNDILEALVGDASELSSEEHELVERADGSVLVDGQYPFYDFLSYFEEQDIYPEAKFNTLSGLLLDRMNQIPKTGDIVHWHSFEFEIVDMDRARIDKVLVRKLDNNPDKSDTIRNPV